MCKKLLLLMLLLPAVSFCQTPLGDSIMPFGAYSSKWATETWFFTSERLGIMHDSLGFNQHMCGGFTPTALNNFNSHGIYPYPWSTWSNQSDPQMMYSHTHYVITHPESDSSQYYKTGFSKRGADTVLVDAAGDTCEYRYYSGDNYMLWGHGLSLHNKYSWFDRQFLYSTILKIGVNPSADTNDIVGIFTVINKNYSTEDSLRLIDTIYVSDLPRDTVFHDTTLTLINHQNGQNYFTARETWNADSSSGVEFFFKTSGQCTVFVDYFKVFDQYAKELMIDHIHDQQIADSVSRDAYEDKILGWFLKDTQNSSNFRPFGYVNSLIDEAMDNANWNYPIYGASWEHTGAYNYYRECVRLAHPKTFWVYIYPFELETEYTGNDSTLGLQYAFNHQLAQVCDSIRSAIGDYDSVTTGWLYTPQFWYCDRENDGCTSNEQRRKPTQAEARCITYMGLCYHPVGILYWKYDTGCDTCNNGITDVNGDPDPPLYNAIKDDINPYLKAIDSTYMNLIWDRAFTYHYSNYLPADGSMISFIKAELYNSEPGTILETQPPEDNGWFHVGEYHDGSNNKYFMLVNRSCSGSRDNPTETNPVTAVVTFDRSVLSNQQYRIIDIAKGTDADDWVGYPETTYTAVMPDSNLYFTTVLKAGEGRLFKIIKSDKISLRDTVNTTYIYQGKVDVTDDIIIPAGANFKLKGPALLRDTVDININVCDSITAIGTAAYPVEFSSCGDDDWSGIVLHPNAEGVFEYCSFSSCSNALSLKESANCLMNQCYFNDIASKAIYSNKGTIGITNCEFDSIGYYGIYADSANTTVTLSEFDNAGRYAIYINSLPSAGYDSTIIAYNVIQKSTAVSPDYSQYSIRVANNDMVRLCYNTLSDYVQGGIYLYNTPDIIVAEESIRDMKYYGLYATQGSDAEITACDFVNITDTTSVGIRLAGTTSPTIRWCYFDSLYYGVKFPPACIPELGDTASGDTTQWGYNNFEGCNKYYIYQMPTQITLPQVKAEMNYYGANGPSSPKFNGTIDYKPFSYTWSRGSLAKTVIVDLPLTYTLKSNYPNPFNPTTNISYSLAEPGHTSIAIYNILGQKITTLVDDYQDAGEHTLVWNGCNQAGQQVSSGIYLYRLESGNYTESKKMLLLR